MRFWFGRLVDLDQRVPSGSPHPSGMNPTKPPQRKMKRRSRRPQRRSAKFSRTTRTICGRSSRGFVTLLTEIRGTYPNCAKRLGIEKGRIYATLAGQNLFGMKCSPGKNYITVFHKLEDSVETRRASRRRPRRWGWRAPEPLRHSCAHL